MSSNDHWTDVFREHKEAQKLYDIIDQECEPYRRWNGRQAQEQLDELRLEDAERRRKAEEAREKEAYEQGEAIRKLFE